MMEFLSSETRKDLFRELIQHMEKAEDRASFIDILKENIELTGLDRLPVIEGAFDQGELVGFHILMRKMPLSEDPGYSPWLGLFYIFEKYRGRKYSPLLIQRACDLAQEMGYSDIYLSSILIQYYEKYGFEEIGLAIDRAGFPVKLYRRKLRD